jgi:hypothetical protein
VRRRPQREDAPLRSPHELIVPIFSGGDKTEGIVRGSHTFA